MSLYINDNRKRTMSAKGIKAVVLASLLFLGGTASAQVVIKGNVYGGGWQGKVLTGTGSSGNASVTINDGTVEGSVYGGGEGVLTDETAGLVQGNTTVTMKGGTVERSIYGGGELGSVGTFTCDSTVTYNAETTVPFPTSCAPGTGLATVLVEDGHVGHQGSRMPTAGSNPDDDDRGWIFCGSQGNVDSINYPRVIAMGVVNCTHLEIKGSALITASVYGGCENGLVLDSTFVEIKGGQIGTGYDKDNDSFDPAYTNWTTVIQKIKDGTFTESDAAGFHECDAWPYGDGSTPPNHYVYDIFHGQGGYNSQGGASEGSDGHSFFGNVFGGGSGYYPMAPGVWRRSAGRVNGNTRVEITGGHILTSIYGGNEVTDVGGKCTLMMTGGTLGVPRTLAQIAAHPVTCYIFGAGMGDPRVMFNTWTNVNNAVVELGGDAFVFGSVFGGGEEGHVIENVKVTIKDNAWIGTWGYSYVDGNIFGGGRGLSGTSLTAGGVGGNVTVNIQQGTMLGSIYGGGRLASVGTHFVPANDQNYGQFQEGDNHGIVKINISGGTIGNSHDDALLAVDPNTHTRGGNVFGGSMGRLKDVNDANYLSLWPSLARVKETHVNITGGTIKNIVYGGSEYGSVYDSAVVVISGNLNIRKVYGGGYGSDVRDAGNNNDSAAFPALLAGRVEGHTLVKVMAGTIGTNVYGGGDLASVGVVKNGNLLRGNTNVVISGGNIGNASNYATTNPSNTDIGHVYGGGQGIQYNFENYKAYCNVNGTNVTIKGGNVYGSVFGGGPDSHVLGNTSVTLQTGAHIGTYGTTEWDGDVFGGGKGNTSSLTAGRVGGNTSINMENGILMGNIYGGGRFGQTGVDVDGAMQTGDHGNTKVMVKGGTVGNSAEIEEFTTFSMGNIYGGGKGYVEDNTGTLPAKSALLLGLTKNTEIEISDTLNNHTHVYGIVLGGGEVANVGRYTLTEDPDTYAITNIAVTDGLSKVKISGGTIGGDMAKMRPDLESTNPDDDDFWLLYNDDLGYVYGGGEGLAVNPASYATVQDTSLVDLIATVQNTEVEISGGWIKASVFGGSESGHVKGDTKVSISGGQIGAGYNKWTNVEYDPYDNTQFVNPLDGITNDDTLCGTVHWAYGSGTPFDLVLLKQGIAPSDGKSWFGNVFGGGSGWFPYVTGEGATAVCHWNPRSGKVWGNTEVIITGGHILNNVYGGNESTDVGGTATVTMSGGTVGVPRTEAQIQALPTYGYVYGGGCGDPRKLAKSINNVDNTYVEITGGIVYGSVFGGAEDGHVLADAEVVIDQTDASATPTNPTVIGSSGFSGYDGHVYGGGRGNIYDPTHFAAGRVAGNTKVTMTKGTVLGSIYGGGFVALVGVDEDGEFSFILPKEHPEDPNVYDSTYHGLTQVEISGGQVGNPRNDGRDLLLSNEEVGNVYGAGRGDINEHIEDDWGRVANAKLTISGTPTIYGSVHGGGQMANVGHWDGYTQWYTKQTATALVDISGSPTIGTPLEFNYAQYGNNEVVSHSLQKTQYETIPINGSDMTMILHSRTGNVYGSGEGDVRLKTTGTWIGHPEGFEQGHCGQTFVNISGTPVIRGSVFGGAMQGAVWGNTHVNIAGGTIGTPNIGSNVPSKTYNYGSVFGGSYGADAYTQFTLPANPSQQVIDSINNLSGHVYGNTYVKITGGTVYQNVFGGGDMASVGQWLTDIDGNDSLVDGKCNVNISGKAIVGPLDGTGLNGYVYGGGKGIGNDPDNLRKMYCNVNETEVTVNLTTTGSLSITPQNWVPDNHGGRVWGSLFGGGADGHTISDTKVNLVGGLIGTEGKTSWDGNIFGGGRNFLHRNYTAGRVGGNVTVDMTGGQILGSIFGGGRLALTGLGEDLIPITTDSIKALQDGNDHGHIKVMVKGGKVGNENIIRTWTASSVGDVFGGGKGSTEGIVNHPASSALLVSLVKSTEVEISGTARIYGDVFGGGEVANVGNYTWKQGETNISKIDIAPNTGHAKVTVSGGTIGMDNMKMITTSGYPDDFGHVFGGGEGWVESLTTSPVVDTEGHHLVELMATVGTTEVTISDTAFVLGSVYGGSMNGHVLDSTYVLVSGGQIGAGDGYTRPYNDDEWDYTQHPYLAECAHWAYEEGGDPYDPNILEGSKPKPGKNGATFFGNVFGGGSGYYPYGVDGSGNSQWLRSAGQVRGNTRVEVTGGHILTSLYGGCETTDVGMYTYDNTIHGEVHASGGRATVIMSGGTLGVPRTLTQIQAHPVTCYVFGSGKGDPRLYFNTWTNVWNTKVEITGTAWVYGSVFGGGEEGHVLNDVDLDVSGNAKIGTLGYSYVDGNIFGGGRGFTGKDLAAGSVGRKVNVDIAGGTMLGSVYGGGRLASVGTYLVDAEYESPANSGTMIPNDLYGQFQPGAEHGKITVNITGGTIGNDHETATLTHTNSDTYGGNVFGGCMGKVFPRETGSSETPIWPSLARAKQTEVTVSGSAVIKNSVYGGGEIGTVRDNTTVNINGGTIGGNYGTNNYCGHVFGGGKGIEELSNDNDSTMVATYLTGRVYGNTYVNINGGQVYENVFGGGKVASVGWVKDGTLVNGKCTVKMEGGIIGPLDMSGVNAYIFGGPKGGNSAMRPYCNVNSTEVEVNYTDSNANRVWGSLFGGGSDGHVLGDTKVTLKDGTVGTAGETGYDGNIFGGGRNYHELSLTAGRVGGNVTVDMQDGTLKGNIFGGGRQGLTGVDVNGNAVNDNTHGNITITVSGGIVGTTTPSATTGHVFGGGKGKSTSATDPQERYGETRSTHVTINGGALVNGNVFGGSENGHVLENTTVIIAGNATIGAAANDWQGRVYGGGRGIDKYEDPANSGTYVYSPTAGKVNGMARTTIKDNAVVTGSVLGGGETGIVAGDRIVNIEGGTVKRHVLGGNNTIPDLTGVESNGLKTVNVRGGNIEGSVFGGSYAAAEGDNATDWNSFVNITGGTIGYATTDVTPSGNVYAAGYGGTVDGSVCLNVGLTAVKNAPTFISGESTSANIHYQDGLFDNSNNPIDPTPAKVKIEGNLFDGSYRYETTPGTDWLYVYDITGHSTMFIDGNGYNTADDNEASTTPYLNIFGGIYGGGNYCESGALGRKVVIKDYGTRNPGGDPTAPVTSVSRTLTTLQRSGIALIDNSNIHFTGEADLSQTYEDRDCFGILTVDDGLYVANGSSFVLGTDIKPAYMDSIVEIRSLHLKTGTSYGQINSIPDGDWEWIGVNYAGTNTPENAHLYYRETNNTTALTYAQENVMVFNGDSRMWVRYKNASTNGKVMYGPIYGFFRVRADEFTPQGTKSFAYARPKLTTRVNPLADYTAPINEGDGGFLSYNTTYNDFTKEGQIILQFPYTTEGDDGGVAFTKTKQYPYYNFSEATTKGNMDMEEYREWVLPVVEGHIWYVDGRGIGSGGWGQDKSHKDGWGDYPDKPKQTITRNETDNYGIFYDPSLLSFINPHTFDPAKDIIFVVGPIQADNENVNLNQNTTYPLKLYRYPGGHRMSNGATDATTSSDLPNPNVPENSSYNGLPSEETGGPGANLGAMINVDKPNFVMENVLVDGLYKETFTPEEQLMYTIPSTYNTEKLNVSEPLVVTASGAQLTLKGNTILQHGYNKIDADTTWYHNADYAPKPGIHDGGALYVDANATVNVEGLVTIEGNLQKNGSGTTECNVYLPTFDKTITMTKAMHEDTRIGVTNPIRKRESNYSSNTFSPVAVAVASDHAVDTATTAWRQNNFYDDQNWFFANEGKTTYYKRSESKTDNRTLYFGWTWANVVREKPDGYVVSTTPGEKTITITSPEGLAWLISRTNGENGETASTLADTTIILNSTADIDLQQYLWAPIGIEGKPFSGNFDGQGHLIKNLTIEHIGAGSGRYENTDFGMFGNVNNDTINRTFVVDGRIQPLGNVNIGGLVGKMQGSNSVISNSEAAVDLYIPDRTGAAENASGGLVGLFQDGEIHSSMAMPIFHVDDYYTVGGLVGYIGTSSGSETTKLNNSFAYPKFLIASNTSPVICGGLAGINAATGSMKNCYARLQTGNSSYLTASNYGCLVHTNQGSVDYCFGFQGDNNTYSLAVTEGTITNSTYFTSVESSDTYGYLYADNTVTLSETTKPLFEMLNDNITSASVLNDGTLKYARWARPTITGINGDYPVLLLSNYDNTDHIGQGGFRSMATYGGGPALQYGGPDRDGDHLNTMLTRMTTSDNVFVYGDVEDVIAFGANEPAKIAIHEDAAVTNPNALTGYANTYVGVSFDNSARHTYDVNGLARDWHMFSTPLQGAPLGIDYGSDNDGTSDPSYNPYTGAGDELPAYPFYEATEHDGYFPYNTPYAEYDFYCFNEYTMYNNNTTIGSPQWINFKRNGNSHYFSQPSAPFNNGHIDYYAYDAEPMPTVNVNESNLIQGKGYLMALQKETYLQSHGQLNGSKVTINVTNKSNNADFGGKGCNLVGNPFHAYLDFDKFYEDSDINSFNIYDADANGYVTYVVDGSSGGVYGPEYIHPHQGFFVKTTTTGVDAEDDNDNSLPVAFKPEMLVTRATATSSVFRDDERPAYPLVNLFAKDAEGHQEILVVEFNRPENGGGKKAYNLRSGNHLMYAHNGNDDYSAFFAKEGTEKVPVRFKTYQDGIFTMHWNTANGDFHSLYLIDNITGITYDMLKNDSYTFNALESDYLSRFYIVFDVTDVEEFNENHIFAFYDGNNWVVNGTGFLQLIDVTGRIIFEERLRDEQNHINLRPYAKGVYLLRLTDNNIVKTQKIIH